MKRCSTSRNVLSQHNEKATVITTVAFSIYKEIKSRNVEA